jgi:hypothetical protein
MGSPTSPAIDFEPTPVDYSRSFACRIQKNGVTDSLPNMRIKGFETAY